VFSIFEDFANGCSIYMAKHTMHSSLGISIH
jgi:hypothetical protein